MSDNLKLLRYNTGTDKHVFIKFKDKMSAVIFNATIVAYSSSAVADLVSVYKNQYIIDPQTHIYQQNIDAVQTENKNGERTIKKSVKKYLDELPDSLVSAYLAHKGNLSPEIIESRIESLVESVYLFETKFVDKYIKGKEYDKYLDFVKLGPRPKVVIAPYFMIKSSYSDLDINSWMRLNRLSAEKFIVKNDNIYPVGIQIVLEKDVLERPTFFNSIKQFYSGIDAEYAFIWIDDLNLFEAKRTQQENFKKLLQILTDINLKPVMAYGGYDAILLCNNNLKFRMYGVAQSVGYGESRHITPVGGGLPVNKYYFPPLHKRLNMAQVAAILETEGYFDMTKEAAAKKFYSSICSCKQCRNIIKDNFDNFNMYNDSIPFKIRGNITRNRPTTDATLISAMHFMHSKMSEWDSVENQSFMNLSEQLIKAYVHYEPQNQDIIKQWCDIYGK